MNVHQLLSGAGPHDAITNEALAFRRCFAGWGWGGHDYALHTAPGVGRQIRPATSLRTSPGDLLVLHHSAALPWLEDLLAMPGRKLLLYHNITPPEWLWAEAPIVAAQCELGRLQLPRVVAGVDAIAADSAFNAAELGVPDAHVVPLLVDPGRLGPPAPARAASRETPELLFVGRLSPHKRQDALIRMLGLLRASRAPGARLTLVGDPITAAYADQLRQLAEATAPGAVEVLSGLPDAALGQRYRSADVLVCASSHEGFCIPVLEALRLGVPVVAHPAGAVGEVAGRAGLLTGPEDDEAVLAELTALVLEDAGLRAELVRRGHERAADFSPDRVRERLRGAVEAALA